MRSDTLIDGASKAAAPFENSGGGAGGTAGTVTAGPNPTTDDAGCADDPSSVTRQQLSFAEAGKGASGVRTEPPSGEVR